MKKTYTTPSVIVRAIDADDAFLAASQQAK